MATRQRHVGLIAALALLSACTLNKQETPSLTGPSELGTSVRLSATPDVLNQDGASQSTVSIQTFDNSGQPLRNVSLRAEILINGTLADFGTLSARNVTTDGSGRAAVVYTAPASGSGVDTLTVVQVLVTPAGTDFGNATARSVSIRLVPVGIVIPPDGMKPDFTMTPTAATDHQPVLFDASSSTWNPANPIETFTWDFGDGDHGTGMTTTHSFDDPGTFLVTLTMTDVFGRSASKTQTMTIGSGGAGLTADIVVSPSPVIAGQQTFFNATASQPGPGHRIVSFDWNFGDGATGSGATPTHTFAATGSYTVVLTVTDEAGHKQTARATVAVTDGSPTAAFTISPTTTTAGSVVSFDGNASTAVGTRTITAYRWSFGDGVTGTGATATHVYSAPGTYSVTLTVTDSAGKSNTSTSQTVTVN